MTLGIAFFLAERFLWSGTPLKAGLRPAAAHCAELRSFRRGWKQCNLSGKTFSSIVARQSVFLKRRQAWRCVRIASVADVEFKADTIAGLFMTGLYLYTCGGGGWGPQSATNKKRKPRFFYKIRARRQSIHFRFFHKVSSEMCVFFLF